MLNVGLRNPYWMPNPGRMSHKFRGVFTWATLFVAAGMSYQLPPEIWIQIYRWAAYSASSDRLYTTEYEPFRSAAGYDADVLDKNLQVKWALVRVCRQWKA